MTNRYGREVDKTFLSVDKAEERGFIHRDYIAHCLRWSHVIKFLGEKQKYNDATILDIGCGREAPLAKMLYSSKMAPKSYVGIDYGKIEHGITFGKYEDRFEFWENEDAANVDLGIGFGFNIITCFEVLEHVEPRHCLKILDNIRRRSTPDADIFISTPVFNGKAAGNHVNEMTYAAMWQVFCQQGFSVKECWGTFASMSDYKDKLTIEEYNVWEDLRNYYDVNMLSCIFAPLYPEYSRNILWHLIIDEPFLPQSWSEIKEPWSSSEKWEELKG